MVSQELNSIFSDAINFAKENRHEYITVEHIFFALIHNVDVVTILSECGANIEVLRENLQQYFDKNIEKSPQVNNFEPFETVSLTRAIEGMMMQIRGAGKKEANITDMLISLFDEEHSYSITLLKQQGVEKLDILEMITNYDDPSLKEENQHEDKKSALEAYTVNLVELAKKDKIDPLVGREEELQRLMQVLCRRKKNNPVLIGEPGVGKSAIVESFKRAFRESKNLKRISPSPSFFSS